MASATMSSAVEEGMLHAPGSAAVLGKVGYGSVVGQYDCDGIEEGYEAPRPGDEIAVSVVGGS